MVTDNCITISANDMQIHQQKEIGLPLYAIISIQNKPNSFAILQFLTAESCFLSYILLSVGIIKSVQTIFL